jgi:Type II secretion system (T2SS), protein M subtype b
MTLFKRILAEKRVWIIPLALGIIANIAVYLLVVYPLGVKSAGAEDRAAAAAQSLQAAERDFAAARDLVTGKTRAEQELATFYDKVLPADLPSARRLTYATLPLLARKSNVKFVDRRLEIEPLKKDAQLGLLKIATQWQGDYESLRRFIYELERAPAFVIIDDVALAQGDANKPLTLSLQLSTYFRLSANGN